ncbi:hypothetical protein CQA49_06900 [Helicobacter sp. MIT 00-7814]|uniref:hypothetical protein n=1 Tax=unclassified Helicobacter TaxID=2593540 RepID=UPI000E1F2464|nr:MULTISPECIES: hypothetical protein [unclassified Helicobacter]RDU53370.1 hypothetical protein CQA49_06900 [Helicobacter sp. MIT 00-7814]RDU54191.1 hypothetical protein CQA37_06140 [Helicobacter sp. MIT 99-10781]
MEQTQTNLQEMVIAAFSHSDSMEQNIQVFFNKKEFEEYLLKKIEYYEEVNEDFNVDIVRRETAIEFVEHLTISGDYLAMNWDNEGCGEFGVTARLMGPINGHTIYGITSCSVDPTEAESMRSETFATAKERDARFVEIAQEEYQAVPESWVGEIHTVDDAETFFEESTEITRFYKRTEDTL